MEKLRVGYIGLGGRGYGVLNGIINNMNDIDIVVVCDLKEDRMQRGKKLVEEKYGHDIDGTLNYHDILARKDIDCILIPSSWNAHYKIAIDSMEAGIPAAFEVGPVSSLQECWDLVRTHERTGVHCMALENCCYGRYEMAMYNMIKKGIFGEVVYVGGGYQHDLRGLADDYANGMERSFHTKCRNGELYPTHELGPMLYYLDINRGNRMLSLTSTSTKARGLYDYINKNGGKEHPLYGKQINNGDITTTVIKCANGENMVLTHDITLPRGYSRGGRVQGTNGIWMEDGDRLYLDGMNEGHEFANMKNYIDQYDHPLWRKYKEEGIQDAHGGMDTLVLRAFFESVRNHEEPPIDVYDSVCMSVVSCLSEQSIAMGSMPVPIPDFTDGKWVNRKPSPKSPYALDAVYDDLFEGDKFEYFDFVK
ncbi:MAG: Gfo/Idh/MocA family oxidoreductase [Clostridiales bacterium]|nr:Gfo/Idh/MocA family oxidoreductase [Clostridiales bacterium]